MSTKSDEYNVKLIHISLKCSVSLFWFYFVWKTGDTCWNFCLFVEEIGPFKIQRHRTKSIQKILMQWRIQDFPNGGASSKGEDINPKNCMKMKRSGLREGTGANDALRISQCSGGYTDKCWTGPPPANFLQFHAVFLKNWPNNRLAHPFSVGVPLWESLDRPLQWYELLFKLWLCCSSLGQINKKNTSITHFTCVNIITF